MQTQDAPAEFIFKLWPWLEANKNRMIGMLVAIILLSGIYYFISSQREQREIAAGQALTALVSDPAASNPSQMAASLEKLASTYDGTGAGRRAQLQAAGVLFESGNYADAQVQFQKYVEATPTGPFAATAQIGVAACFEALNKPDLAASAYQKVLSSFPSSPYVSQAEFGLGRIAEQQGKLSEAAGYYGKVTATGAGGTLAQEAALRASEVKLKMAAAAPKSAAATQVESAIKSALAPKPAATTPPAAKP